MREPIHASDVSDSRAFGDYVGYVDAKVMCQSGDEQIHLLCIRIVPAHVSQGNVLIMHILIYLITQLRAALMTANIHAEVIKDDQSDAHGDKLRYIFRNPRCLDSRDFVREYVTPGAMGRTRNVV
jgi:hypothetical protein